MNSLQSELDSINSQLELLTYRKTQLDTIMGEYSEVVSRVKNLINSMQDAMIEPVNLLIEIEGLIHGQGFEAVEPIPEPITETKPEPAAVPKLKPDDIVQHKNDELWHGRQFRVKGIKGFEVLCIFEGNTGDVAYSFPADAVQLVTPEPTPEPTTEPTPEPSLLEILLTQSENKPELTQLNSRAWRRDNTLLIGFSNKRLLNTWSNWFKSSWSGQIYISENNDKVEGFEHCLGILWYGSMPEVKRWERLTNLDYTFKPDEQQGQAIVKVVEVA